MHLTRLPLLLTAISLVSLTSCQSDLTPLTSNLQLGSLQPGLSPFIPGSEPRPPAQSQPAPPPQPAAPAPAPVASAPPAAACSAGLVEKLLTPASSDPSPVKLNCSVQLPPQSVVTRQIIFEGRNASGSTLDCNGARLENAGKGGKDAIIVRSREDGQEWSRPVGVTVKNCEIAGAVRIYGLGRNGEAEAVKQSSMNANHTRFAQAAAPANISFDRVRITGSGGVPFYVSPGATNVALTNSTIRGSSTSVAVYLDAESAGARIANNTFDISTKSREIIAVDGSAHNDISNNRFNRAGNGGVYVYRNCGEGGTIRHQAPQFNRIERNSFVMNGSRDPAVWLNSRNGNRSYCFQDPTRPYGSSLTSMDMAQNNTVDDNTATGSLGDAFRNSDPTNRLSNNRR